MSNFDIRKLTCQKCNEEFDCKVYTSINVTVDPNLKKELLNGNIYNYTCPRCGQVHTIVSPLIYHDMEKKVMIIADEFEEALLAKSTFTQLNSQYNVYNDYKFYNAATLDELIEIIHCLDLNLQPAKIQLMKLLIVGTMQSQEENLAVESIGFYNDEKGTYFAIWVDNNGHKEKRRINFNSELYNKTTPDIHLFEKRNEMFNSFDYIYKLISYDLKDAEKALETKYNIAICKGQNGRKVHAKVEDNLLDKLEINKDVVIKTNGRLKKYKLLDIITMSEFEYPFDILDLPNVSLVS